MPYKDKSKEYERNKQRYLNSRVPCPLCGELKSAPAKLCKKCMNKNNVGPNNPHWVGDNSKDKYSTGHQRAQRMYSLGRCEVLNCEKYGEERHHIDNNPMNNDISNIAILCSSHHRIVHARKIKFTKGMYIESETPRNMVVCGACGIKFKQPTSRSSKFCSIECYRDYRKKMSILQKGRFFRKGDKLIS